MTVAAQLEEARVRLRALTHIIVTLEGTALKPHERDEVYQTLLVQTCAVIGALTAARNAEIEQRMAAA